MYYTCSRRAHLHARIVLVGSSATLSVPRLALNVQRATISRWKRKHRACAVLWANIALALGKSLA